MKGLELMIHYDDQREAQLAELNGYVKIMKELLLELESAEMFSIFTGDPPNPYGLTVVDHGIEGKQHFIGGQYISKARADIRKVFICAIKDCIRITEKQSDDLGNILYDEAMENIRKRKA